MRLSLWVVMCLCRLSVTYADGYGEESADDSEEEPEGAEWPVVVS